jgi:hypothetical protein
LTLCISPTRSLITPGYLGIDEGAGEREVSGGEGVCDVLGSVEDEGGSEGIEGVSGVDLGKEDRVGVSDPDEEIIYKNVVRQCKPLLKG